MQHWHDIILELIKDEPTPDILKHKKENKITTIQQNRIKLFEKLIEDALEQKTTMSMHRGNKDKIPQYDYKLGYYTGKLDILNFVSQHILPMLVHEEKEVIQLETEYGITEVVPSDNEQGYEVISEEAFYSEMSSFAWDCYTEQLEEEWYKHKEKKGLV